MKKRIVTKKRIIAHYNHSSVRHPDQKTLWEENMEVKNAQDVFEFMRKCHLRSSKDGNDYPLKENWGKWVMFFSQVYHKCDLGHIHYGDKVLIKQPDFYEEACDMYNQWVSRINRTIPYLRKAEKLRRTDNLKNETA